MQKFRVGWLSAALIAGGTLGILFGILLPRFHASDASKAWDDGTALRWPTPKTIQELVDRSDVIVIGRVAGLAKTADEGPYNEPAPMAKSEFPAPLLPVTYYDLQIESVLLDDGNILSAPSLRLAGTPETASPPGFGRKTIFFLRRNSDRLSYGVNGDWAMIDWGRQPVTEFDGGRVAFASGLSTNVFVAEVRASIPRKQPWELRLNVTDVPK